MAAFFQLFLLNKAMTELVYDSNDGLLRNKYGLFFLDPNVGSNAAKLIPGYLRTKSITWFGKISGFASIRRTATVAAESYVL